MRLAVACCSLMALFMAVGAADAQQDRMRRGDDPVPVAKTAAKQKPATKRHRVARKPSATEPSAATPAPADAPAVAASRRDMPDCLQVGDQERQITGCTHLIDDAKQSAKVRAAAYYNRGNARAAKNDFDDAIADYDEAIKLTPKDARVLNNRGTVYRDKGDAERAMADFAAAIKINRRYSDAHYNLGAAYAAKGETAKAIAAYGAAIAADRRNANAYVARGIAQLYAGASAKAQADLRMAARIAPTNAYAALWNDIALRHAKRPGTFAVTGRRVDMNAWPAPVVRLWRGEITPTAMFAAADNPNATTKQAQMCEANFYGGELALLKGTKDDATKLLQAAASDCPQPFLERMAASAELKALGVKTD